MSIALAVATGLVSIKEMKPGDFRRLRKKLRAELRASGVLMRRITTDYYAIKRKRKRSGHEVTLCVGTLENCCHAALEYMPFGNPGE